MTHVDVLASLEYVAKMLGTPLLPKLCVKGGFIALKGQANPDRAVQHVTDGWLISWPKGSSNMCVDGTKGGTREGKLFCPLTHSCLLGQTLQ